MGATTGACTDVGLGVRVGNPAETGAGIRRNDAGDVRRLCTQRASRAAVIADELPAEIEAAVSDESEVIEALVHAEETDDILSGIEDDVEPIVDEVLAAEAIDFTAEETSPVSDDLRRTTLRRAPYRLRKARPVDENLDTQISNLDERLDALEELVSSIEQSLADFEPLLEDDPLLSDETAEDDHAQAA